MVFSSSIFLFVFLPIFLLFYYLSRKEYRNIILLSGGVIFYAWGAPLFIFLLLLTTLIDFFLAKAIYTASSDRKRKRMLVFSVCLNLGLLFWFKYFGFFAENFNLLCNSFGLKSSITVGEIVMPIGISFFIFESITYVTDVYRRIHKPLTNFWDYQMYIILFPKLIAGPIVRYHEIADQITDRSSNENVNFKLAGFYRFCIGLAKKILIADLLAIIVNQIFGEPGKMNPLPQFAPHSISASAAWIGALAYTFQIYFDFSGYSDMAIGLGKMLGFRFPENFNHPYTANGITDFWRRWHMTLGNWMKNYLYIPLGGNRSNSIWRNYFNLWLVFLLSGLWHGAGWNFLLWGAWHGTFLVAEKVVRKKDGKTAPQFLFIPITFLMVVIGWVIFRVENISVAFGYLKAMFGFSSGTADYQLNNELILVLIFAIIFSFAPVFKKVALYSTKISEANFRLGYHFVVAGIAVLLFILSASYLVSSNFHPFIYYRF